MLLPIAAALLLAQVPVPPQDARPNVLVLIADDLGVDKIGCYRPNTSPPPPSTPVIDGLAANGVRFEHAYANPLCSPTRACIQTGRYGFRNGIGTVVRSNNTSTNQGPMSPDEITLAEMLDAGNSGYAHAFVGKWHLGYHQNLAVPGDPFNQGYGRFAGTKGNFSPRTIPPEHYASWPKTTDGATATSTTFATTDNVDEALAFITAQGERPWLCCVAFNAPHAPLQRPPSSGLPHMMPAPGEDAWPYYNAMVEHMDAEIGRLLASASLAQPGAMARTLVLFTADNGTPGGPAGPSQLVFPPFQPGRAKGTVFEGGVHVPLIAQGFLVDQPGRESDALVHLVDVFATVAELAGVDLSQPGVIPAGRTIDSISFLPVLADAAAAGARAQVFCEFFEINNPAPGTLMNAQRALRNAQYKLVRYTNVLPPDAEYFYDVASDPFELDDLLLHPGGLLPQEQQAYAELSADLDALLTSP